MIATPFFGTVMSEYRFSLIMKFLHFANNDTFEESTHPAPKLKKIWEVCEMVVENFRTTYVPERDIFVDESLMAYKGRLSWLQFIASKRARFGIKNLICCVSLQPGTSGIQFCTPEREQSSIPGSATMEWRQVLFCHLLSRYWTRDIVSPRTIFILPRNSLEILIKRCTDACGTVRPNRREMPTSFGKQKLKPGDIAAWQKGKMLALRWRDKKDVCLLSRVHDTSTVPTKTRGGKEIQKPQVVVDYNQTMGGVDRADQAVTFYPAVRKQQKYYKKIFWSSLCGILMYFTSSAVKGQLLTRTTYGGCASVSVCGTRLPQMPEPGDVPPMSLTQSDTLAGTSRSTYLPLPKKTTPTRTCVVCCSKTDERGKKVRKESRIYCPDCNVGLCAAPCFKTYHTREVY
ncbi:piggyBac transposable element-derived protein 4-like [Hyperolius riggenbachi]|uniref:piggyBac transposable element-derived protein 4-like n=1 Tax=Hyperolius riggenbachi TaxID=752182 RepID=UPI0035A35566